ncbi:MAG TPA: hypothetical protein VME19_02225 [Streptosporangiaceae bacterium]|nr:hypothetical protein [Streptosporangiaceae bacterium]
MAHGMVKLTSGRHTRRAGPAFWRRLTLGSLVTLVVVYGLRIGGPGASLAMALLTGVALVCYLGALARASSARRRTVSPLPPNAAPVDDPAPPPRPRAVWPAGGPFSKLVVPARGGRPLPTPAQPPTSWFTPD